eukprot:3583649-Pyramimonas_sp.AAC.1
MRSTPQRPFTDTLILVTIGGTARGCSAGARVGGDDVQFHAASGGGAAHPGGHYGGCGGASHGAAQRTSAVSQPGARQRYASPPTLRLLVMFWYYDMVVNMGTEGRSNQPKRA